MAVRERRAHQHEPYHSSAEMRRRGPRNNYLTPLPWPLQLTCSESQLRESAHGISSDRRSSLLPQSSVPSAAVANPARSSVQDAVA